ncbi:MAG: ATP-binding cassette domain-containing protein, partial [Oscillospiraceae bacterium]|nr:ATP-binding cassette domain-containing protein [Oscillospiraceae bacterium]
MFFIRLWQQLPGAVSLGLLWGIMTLGVYMTYRILDFPDLTVDGSFALGGAVVAQLVTLGVNPFLATLFSFGAGLLAGAVTGLLHTKLKIPGLLASILTQISLYSVNLHIMTQANLSLPNVISGGARSYRTVFALLPSLGLDDKGVTLAYGLAMVAMVVLALWWFLGTEKGITILSTGDNAQMSRALGVHTDHMVLLCLMLANGLVGLSGGLIAQNNRVSTLDMGAGGIVFGLAAVIIGEVIFRRRSLLGKLVAVVLGSIVYRIIQSVVLLLKWPPEDFKILSAAIIAAALALPTISAKLDPWLIRMGWKKPRPPQETAPALVEASPSAPAEASAASVPAGDTSLKVAGISKVFNRGTINQKNALVDVELTLAPGDFITVIGGNGAGKSTLLNIVAGVFPVDGGGIAIGSNTITAEREYRRARLIGRVFQDPMLGTAPNMTIEENLSIAMRRGQRRGLRPAIHKEERAYFRQALRSLDLGLEDRLKTRVGLLSGGQRQAL